VGTAKRERQKANRQLKLQELEKDYRKQKAKRRGLQFAILIPLGVVLLIGLILILGRDNGDDTDIADTVATTVVATTVPEASTSAGVTTSGAATSTTAVALPMPCPKEDGSSEKTQSFGAAPPMCIDPTKTYIADVATNKGGFTITFDATKAPQTVNNFVYLARYHYFDGVPCHRIIPNFVVQCGDPTGTGSGGPGYTFNDELPEAGEYQLGSVAMANSGPNTNGSQFFIITGDNGMALDPNYSLFGQVTDGFEGAVRAMEAAGTEEGEPTEPITLQTVTIREQDASATTSTPAATTTATGSTTATTATTAAPTTAG
jgi:cyclophilin family peptidyl-prolyl cis-trans isomerase